MLVGAFPTSEATSHEWLVAVLSSTNVIISPSIVHVCIELDYNLVNILVVAGLFMSCHTNGLHSTVKVVYQSYMCVCPRRVTLCVFVCGGGWLVGYFCICIYIFFCMCVNIICLRSLKPFVSSSTPFWQLFLVNRS